MRSGFNLLMAIFIILLLAGASVLTLKYTSISAKHFADSYIKEQAEIFSQSVLETTILKIEGTDRSTECLTLFSLDSADGKFTADVNISTYYLYADDYDNATGTNCNNVKKRIQTEESNGYVLINITVQTNSSNNKIGDYISPVRIVTRSLQRP
ncbi:hypothetical protein [Sulfurimonas hydrogeniphila]|uniref:hypothetical protein n=1 Tax=Sulfurimonas hydrogeniphila TaxID=2509341 RepID=UPI00125EEEE7|nr:hypothetical protein [Sulfurimonas hydrogeniphila]